jgi:O-antigen/teichoic acid export membrane protein
VVVACWALAVTFAAVALCYDLPVVAAICLPEIPSRRRAIRRWFRPCWQRGRLTRLAGLAMPLGLTVVTGAFIANVCRYFLYYYRGPDELGIFAAMSWFTLVGALVATAVAHAALPHLAQRFAAGDRAEFYRLLRFLLISGALAGLLAILLGVVAGPMILATLYGPEYARHATSFTLLVASVAFSIEICYLDHALYAARRFLVQAPLNLAVGGLMLIACYAVIPQAGILGAAWITCLAAAAQMLARLGIVWRIIGEMRFRQSRPPTTLVVGVDVWPVSP